MTQTTLTKNERALLRAFWTNDYTDGNGDSQPSTWSFAVTDSSGIAAKSAPGVFSSLSKKGLISVHDRAPRENYNAVDVTKLGFEVARDLGLIVQRPDVRENFWSAAPEQKEVEVVESTPSTETLEEENTTMKTETKKTPAKKSAKKTTRKNSNSRSPESRRARAILRRYLALATELSFATTADYAADDLATLNSQYENASRALASLPNYGSGVSSKGEER